MNYRRYAIVVVIVMNGLLQGMQLKTVPATSVVGTKFVGGLLGGICSRLLSSRLSTPSDVSAQAAPSFQDRSTQVGTDFYYLKESTRRYATRLVARVKSKKCLTLQERREIFRSAHEYMLQYKQEHEPFFG